MAAKRTTRTRSTGGAGAEVALIGYILANLHQFGKNQGLESTVHSLQRLIEDWQQAYSTLDGQLRLALDDNRRLNDLVSLLRGQLRTANARTSDLERRLLESEARRRTGKSA